MILDSKEEGIHEHFVSVRVERVNGATTFTYGGAAEWLFRHPYSRETAEQMIREKLSLLMLAPVGISVKGIGRKLGTSPEVYYVRIFEEDINKIKEEQDDLRLRG
jgi:hypothetical protein